MANSQRGRDDGPGMGTVQPRGAVGSATKWRGSAGEYRFEITETKDTRIFLVRFGVLRLFFDALLCLWV